MKKNHNSREAGRRVKKTLSNPSTRKESKAWAKGASVFTSLAASCAIIYGASTTLPANAISLPSIQSLAGTLKSVLQADATTTAIQVQTAQTAQSAVDINKKTVDAEFKKAATITGEAQARSLAELYVEMQPGRGIAPDFSCIPQAERTGVVTKGVLSKNSSSGEMHVAASGYNESTSDKRAKRTFDHLNYFCDITEVAQGNCLPQPNGLGGMDSNYATIAANSLLTEDTEHAAYAYMLNVIDPSATSFDKCESHACDVLETTNRVYQALSSMSHNAFINQINDAKVLTFSSKQKEIDEAEDESLKGLPDACRGFIKAVNLGNQKYPDALLSYSTLAEEIRKSYAGYTEADKKEAQKVCEAKTKEVAEVMAKEDEERAKQLNKAAEAAKSDPKAQANNAKPDAKAPAGNTKTDAKPNNAKKAEAKKEQAKEPAKK